MDDNVMQFPYNTSGVSQPMPGPYNVPVAPVAPVVPQAPAPKPFGGNVAGQANGLVPTTIQELSQVAAGTVVRFPDFAEGMPFVARVRRPSMLVLAKSGKIPNALLKSASDLFTGDLSSKDANVNMLADVYSVCEIICEASLIQPSWAELKAAGVELSDDQLMAIFNYSQNGIKALQPFR